MNTHARASAVTPAGDAHTVLLATLAAAGYARIETAILQDATPFLDLGGEDIRGSLYLTADRHGSELCLRPEYTIPVCRSYLQADLARPMSYAYCGPVFRTSAEGRGETVQAGLESFGRTDTAAADAEVLSLALEAVAAVSGEVLAVQFSDAGLFARLLDALQLPPRWQRRLKRGLDRGETPTHVLAAAPASGSDHAGVLAALAGSDAMGARALVDDLLSIAGITSVGGRTATEIAERFLDQVALRATPPFGEEQRAVLDRFLAISGHPDDASGRIRALATEAGLDLNAALDLFDERVSFFAANGLDLAATGYSGSFGRNLDYYTGFVFEARHPAVTVGPIIGGGRYDRLAQALGSAVQVPAVGAAIWIDRLPGTAPARSGRE